MTEEPMNDLVDGMERMGMMTFDDLPDVVIMQIFDKLDFRSRFRMRRVNKRMNGIQPKIKNNLEKIEFELPFRRPGKLVLTEHGSETVTIGPKVDYALAYHMSRLTVNTDVYKKVLVLHRGSWTRERDQVINEFFKIDADELHIRRPDREDNDDFYNRPFDLTQITLSFLLPLAQKLERIELSIYCTTLTAQDLCLIRKMMIEGNCKLKSFSVVVEEEVQLAFMKECFGITTEDNFDTHTRIFYASDESVEMYMYENWARLHHFEGEMWTKVVENKIGFTKCNGGAKPEKNYEKVEMNYLDSLD